MRPSTTALPTCLILSLGAGTVRAAEVGASFGAEASATDQGAQAEADGTGAAQAEPASELRPESGFQHALRVGLSMPAGVSSEGRALGDDVNYRVPIMLDVGYRASRLVYLGILGVAGVDSSADDCGLARGAPQAVCTLEGWRLAAEVLLHPLDPDSVDLWLGAALGWEQLQQKAQIPSDMASTFGSLTLRTVEQGPTLDLQAGIDFPVEGKLAAGPFVGYTGGMYVDRETECATGAPCPAESIDEVGLHHWLTLGVRGRFGP